MSKLASIRDRFAARDRHAVRKASFRLRPTLMALEDRKLLSAIVVNNPTDTPVVGQIDLRQAIAQANTDGQADTITFDGTVFSTPQTITLSSGGLDLTNTATTTITGPGANLLSISGNNASRVFTIASGASAALSGLTITGGFASPDGGGLSNLGSTTLADCTIAGNSAQDFGGGVLNAGTLNLDDCSIANNHALSGGGLDLAGGSTAIMQGCTITGNTAISSYSPADGGGVFVAGSLTANDSTFSGNQTNGRGGAIGIYGVVGTAVLTGCTVAGNQAPNGAGVQCDGPGASVTMTDGTVTDNVATGNGGGVDAYDKVSATLSDCTISGNSASHGGGLAIAATSSIANTIVAGNTATGSGPDAFGTFGSQGNNLIGKTDGGTGWGASDLTGTVANPRNPLLGALADNGGPTKTMALLPGSPAIDAGNNALIPAGVTTDQRGLARIVNGTVDIGAFEVNKVASTTTVTGGTFTYDGTAHAGSGSVDVSGGIVTLCYTGINGTTYSSATAPTNAGTYTVTATYAGDDTHDGSTASAPLTITPKPLQASAWSQGTINLGSNGSIVLHLAVDAGQLYGTDSVASLFNGATFTIAIQQADGSVTYGTLTSVATVEADGSITVSMQMSDDLRAELYDAYVNGRAVNFNMSTTAIGGNYTFDQDTMSRLLNNGALQYVP